MKKIFIFINYLLSFTLIAHAQENVRAPKELAGFPTQNFSQLDINAAKIANWSERELIDLAVSLPTESSPNPTMYALSGLTGYVSFPSRENLRKKVSTAYAKATGSIKDIESQSFLLQQLEIIAKDESTTHVEALLSKSALVDPVCRVLTAIGSPSARQALITGLSTSSPENTAFFLGALGYLKEPKAVDLISKFADSKNESIRKTALLALSEIADSKSNQLLKTAAEATGYSFDKSNAFGAYLNYIKNVGLKDRTTAIKLSQDLVQKTNSHETPTRIASTALLIDLQKEKYLTSLEAVLKESDKTYRIAVLHLLEPYMDEKHAIFWIDLLKRCQSDIKIDLINILATTGIQSFLPPIKELIDSPDPNLRLAAISSIGQLGGETVLNDYLAILKKGDSKEIAVIKQALLPMKSQRVNEALREALSTLPWASRATVLSVLNENKIPESAPVFSIKEFDIEAEKKEGFHILFDGTDMTQWTGNTKDYTIEYGEMVINPSKGSGGNLYTKEEFSDFIFRFEFKLSDGANNGLGVRAPLSGDVAYQGIEIQIIDNEAEKYKNLKPYQYHGSLYGIMEAKKGALNPVGMWNYQEVYVKGDHFKVILNGRVILDGSITEAKEKGTLDNKEHPGLFRDTGHIAFLGHGDQVYFKNIRVKRL